MGKLTAYLLWLNLAGILLLGCGNNQQANLQQELGFRHSTPVYVVGGQRVEVFALSSVQPNSVFAKAGLKSGDVVLEFQGSNAINEFYEFLETSRGKRITLRVVAGGNGLALAKRPVRNINFIVPAKT